MMTTSATLLLLLPLVSACGARVNGHTIQIDSTCTSEQIVGIRSVTQEWNGFTNEPTFEIVPSDAEWSIKCVTPDPLPPWGELNGYTDWVAHEIKVRPVVEARHFRNYTRHELGHSLAIGHVDRGVMQIDSGDRGFSQRDQEECLRVQACDPNHLAAPTDIDP